MVEEKRIFQSVDEAVESLRNDIISMYRELIRTRSYTGEEGEVQGIVARMLAGSGVDVDTFIADFDIVSKHPEYAPSCLNLDTPKDKSPYEGRPNVVGKMVGTGGGRSLLLWGHIDSIPAGSEEKWTYPPFAGKIVNGRIYGRGCADNKGGVLIAIGTVMALKRAGIKPKGDIYVASVVDEEIGGAGGMLAVVLKGYRPDGAIYLHPLGPGLRVVYRACSGGLSFKIKVFGKSAHNKIGHTGINAIEKSLKIFNSLQELNIARSLLVKYAPYDAFFEMSNLQPCHTHMTLGVIRGGIWPSQVPDQCEITCVIEFPPNETCNGVRTMIENRIEEVVKQDTWLVQHPPAIDWIWNFVPAETDENHFLVRKAVKVISRVKGEEPLVGGLPSFSDMRYLIKYGDIPTICFGPLGGNIHEYDEWVDVEDLLRAIKIAAIMAVKWCDRHD